MEVLLSFIVPNLNSGDLLQQTVNSIISKNFDYVYEIQVVDGLSTDHSIDFIKYLNEKNIFLIEKKDVNVYDAMNKGVNASNGKWLMFLGAGDTITDKFLKINMKLYSKSKLIYGSVFWKSKGLIYDGPFTLKKLFYKNICQQAIVYNRICFDNSKLFNLKYFINADYDFNLNIFINYFNEISFVNLVMCNYHGNGISHYKTDNFNKLKNKVILKKLLENKRYDSKIYLIRHLIYIIYKKAFNSKEYYSIFNLNK
jgi:glycosyltransferase involved in cell wall biosynthesis